MIFSTTNPNLFSNNGHPLLIKMQQVVKIYDTAAGGYKALKGIDLEINHGEFVGIIGRSGSGKSTLINMITGIDRPTTGEVWVGDTAVHTLSENQMARWRGRNLGIVFQFFQLLPNLSVLDNVRLPMDFCHSFPVSERRQRALQILEVVEMAEHAAKLPSALSGGQQQRVAIARALANDPTLIIADEPTGNLDSKTADAVFQLFESLVAEGKTVVMVTHDGGLARRVQRTVVIADGEVVNEYVVKALPSLSPALMLEVSHKAKTAQFAPGETILQQDAPGELFYIVTKGRAEVMLKRPNGTDILADIMKPGQYFGEMSLMNSKRTSASVCAMPEAPLETLTLDRQTFQRLLDESPAFNDAMKSVIAARQENILALREGQVVS
jgi:ABC-type lipoprotein export system ATPase subunit